MSNVTEILDEIKLRDEHVWKQRGKPEALLAIEAAKDDVTRLLAAVDAVLGRHKAGRFALLGALCAEHEVYRMFSITSDEADRVAICPRCSATVARTCDACMFGQWPCPDVRAVTSALLGERRVTA